MSYALAESQSIMILSQRQGFKDDCDFDLNNGKLINIYHDDPLIIF
jgi:hypothetical protein